MTAAHILYVPLVLLVGFFLGNFVGRAQLRRELAEEERRQRVRAERRAGAAAQSSSSTTQTT